MRRRGGVAQPRARGDWSARAAIAVSVDSTAARARDGLSVRVSAASTAWWYLDSATTRVLAHRLVDRLEEDLAALFAVVEEGDRPGAWAVKAVGAIDDGVQIHVTIPASEVRWLGPILRMLHLSWGRGSVWEDLPGFEERGS